MLGGRMIFISHRRSADFSARARQTTVVRDVTAGDRCGNLGKLAAGRFAAPVAGGTNCKILQPHRRVMLDVLYNYYYYVFIVGGESLAMLSVVYRNELHCAGLTSVVLFIAIGNACICLSAPNRAISTARVPSPAANST